MSHDKLVPLAALARHFTTVGEAAYVDQVMGAITQLRSKQATDVEVMSGVSTVPMLLFHTLTMHAAPRAALNAFAKLEGNAWTPS